MTSFIEGISSVPGAAAAAVAWGEGARGPDGYLLVLTLRCGSQCAARVLARGPDWTALDRGADGPAFVADSAVALARPSFKLRGAFFRGPAFVLRGGD